MYISILSPHKLPENNTKGIKNVVTYKDRKDRGIEISRQEMSTELQKKESRGGAPVINLGKQKSPRGACQRGWESLYRPLPGLASGGSGNCGR